MLRRAFLGVSASVALALVLAAAVPACAQVPRRAALKVQALGVFASTPFLAAGPGVVWRTTPRFTIELNAVAGVQEREPAGRGELAVGFHVDPLRTTGAGLYAFGGAAVAVRAGSSAEYLLVGLGLESQPGQRRGWFVELGVGGGVRAAAGARFWMR